MAGPLLALALLILWPGGASAAAPADDYPQHLERELARLLASGARDSHDPRVLRELADLYLDIGDEAYPDPARRIAAYEEGARVAQRILERNEADGLAHYLYAANAGSAAELKGMMASALLVKDLKAHVTRALELHPDYPPAHHMLGRMLEELPWFLGGDSAAGLDHLKRAVDLDPGYVHARMDLAKSYLKRRQTTAAKRELLAIIRMSHPRNPYTWRVKYRPEAERLLAGLEQAGGR
jgi:tetratricopeptide (TPR) repeat protein